MRSDAARRLGSDVRHAGAEEQAFQATGHVALLHQLVAAEAPLAGPDGETPLLPEDRALAVVGGRVRKLRLHRVQQLRPPLRVQFLRPADVRPRTGARATHAGRAVGGPPRPATGARSSSCSRGASVASTLLCAHSSCRETRGQKYSDANEVE